MVSNVEYLRLFHSCDDIGNGDFSRLDAIADEYESLEARVADLEKDAARINWLESFVSKQYVYGVSFDYAKSFEGERGGYRLMARRRLGERKDSLRESIDDAMSREA